LEDGGGVSQTPPTFLKLFPPSRLMTNFFKYTRGGKGVRGIGGTIHARKKNKGNTPEIIYPGLAMHYLPFQ
jgi:hypothetical protein